MSLFDVMSKLSTGEVAGWAVTLVIILMSLVQIAPVKLNPWDRVLEWVGDRINGKTLRELADVDSRVSDLQKQVTDIWISSHRQNILTFARECRAEIGHDAEEWNHVLSIADEYEVYCNSHEVSNGVVKANTTYIRDLYQKLSREHKI